MRIPDQSTIVFNGSEVDEMISRYNSDAHSARVHLSRYSNDWNLGEGDVTAFIYDHVQWGVGIDILHRHSNNYCFGHSPSILEVTRFELSKENARLLAREIIRLVGKEEGE